MRTSIIARTPSGFTGVIEPIPRAAPAADNQSVRGSVDQAAVGHMDLCRLHDRPTDLGCKCSRKDGVRTADLDSVNGVAVAEHTL